MSNFKVTGRLTVVLALAGLLIIACQAAATPAPSPEAQPVAVATASPTASALPTEPPVPEIVTDAPAPEPSPLPTLTPTITPTAEPDATPDAGRALAHEIRSIEEISVAGPPQIVDITAADAVLLFESSIPLACSVVYGKTTEYGQISVDQDMSGGAHTDHHPLLLGLEPDTEYHYRVQGTAADGTLYVGEDGTFRTPPAESETEVNLASLEAGAQIIAASSNFGGAADEDPWGANSAIDGQRGTAWSTNGDGNDAFLEIELAQPARLRALEVWTRSMGDGTAQIFVFTLTTDDGDVLGPFDLPDATKAYRFELEEVVARSLRLDVEESSGGNTGLVEFAVYGTPVEE